MRNDENSAAAIIKPEPKKRSLKRLLSLLLPEKASCVAAVGLLGVSTGVTLSVPLCVQKTVDAIFKTEETSGIFQGVPFENVCLMFAGLFAVGAVANAGRIWFIQSASCRVVKDLRLDVYSSLLHHDMTYFDGTSSGELVNRLSADCQLVGDVLTQNVSDVLRSFGQSFVSIGLMIYVAPDLALRAAAIVPSIMIVALCAGKFVRKISKSLQDNLAAATSRAEEGFSGIKVVKAFGAVDQEIRSYEGRLGNILSLGYKSAAVNSVYWSFLGGSGNMALLIVLYSGYKLSMTGAISPGTLTAFLLYTVYSGIGVAGLGKAYGSLMSGAGAADRLFEIVDRQVHKKASLPTIPVENFRGDITFSDVVFRYPSRQEELILNGFSEVLDRQKTTAVVGSSGSGKSTISWLLTALYNAENGTIKIGDYNIRDIPANQLAGRVSIVPQEPPLFTGSIYDNIVFGLDTYTDDQVQRAASIADVLSFTDNFPDGLGTEVGAKGKALSGGQKQRIAIARAVVRNPDILILDEATSALDTATESKVMDGIGSHVNCTTVIIAHRLSTILKADKIVVLHKGKVKEVGDYETLVASGGMFSDLVKLQESA
eukprot:sb/3463222/